MEDKYYIYAHTIKSHGCERPFGQIFYIGRGFERRAYNKSSRTAYWKRIVNKYGYNVHFFETELTEEQVILAEKRYIKAIGREDLGQGTLINFTDGGEGNSNLSIETRKKMSEARKKRITKKETREKISKSLIGNKRNLGKHFSEETKQKMSEDRSGEKHPLFGKHHKEETKNKIREGNMGKIISQESKKKMSDVKKHK